MFTVVSWGLLECALPYPFVVGASVRWATWLVGAMITVLGMERKYMRELLASRLVRVAYKS
jgi:hypothetical protein